MDWLFEILVIWLCAKMRLAWLSVAEYDANLPVNILLMKVDRMITSFSATNVWLSDVTSLTSIVTDNGGYYFWTREVVSI